jgi:hypothetical protein
MANPRGNPQNLIPFRPGQSGNPGGKPVHARNHLSGRFLSELAEDFDQYGRAAIVACRKRSPSRYLAIIAAVLPKELMFERDRTPAEYSDEELTAMLELVHKQIEYLEQAGSNAVNGDSTVGALGAINGTQDGR